MKISILGAGAFGTAIGGILASKGYDIDYYDPKLRREVLSSNLESAKYIILAMPSESLPFLLPHLPLYKPIIVATKGILSDKYLKPFRNYMVMSGPGFANDIKSGKQIILTATDPVIDELFETDSLKFDHTEDRLGVLMCGALKNVYAIFAGYLHLERETSDWLNYIKTATMEIKEILLANGADPNTVNLACGIPDLKLTCGYPSRNYEYGDILRANPGYLPEKTVEGLSTIKRIRQNEILLPDKLQLLPEILKLVTNKE